jgi:hypothetical protein
MGIVSVFMRRALFSCRRPTANLEKQAPHVWETDRVGEKWLQLLPSGLWLLIVTVYENAAYLMK